MGLGRVASHGTGDRGRRWSGRRRRHIAHVVLGHIGLVFTRLGSRRVVIGVGAVVLSGGASAGRGWIGRVVGAARGVGG